MKKTTSRTSRTKLALLAGVLSVMMAITAVACSNSPTTKDDTNGASQGGTTEQTDTSGATDAATASGAINEADWPLHVANADGGAGLASYHAGFMYTCESCHEGDFGAQIAALGVDGEPALTSTFFVDNDACFVCHGSWEALAAKTASLGDYNPHDSIHGTIEYCNECHKGHSAQVDICGECHPNGGQTMQGTLA